MSYYIVLLTLLFAIILVHDECKVGPTNKVSLRENPVEDFAEASKTARIFVVVLDSFTTTCMGKYNVSLSGFCISSTGTSSA